jgi:hypothetical protein
MAELEHSRRSMPRATYTPIRVARPRDGDPPAA